MKAMSKTYWECNYEAKAKGVDLFPLGCLDILKKNYGKRLESMKPQTILEYIYSLMQVLIEDPDENEIIEVVNNYIES